MNANHYLFFWFPPSRVAPETDGQTKYGGWGNAEADWEEYRAKRRLREQELEQSRKEAAELKDRLDRASEELQRKVKAKKESKARKAIQERVDRFARELEAAELQITQNLIEIRLLEQQAQVLLGIDRRRRLLLLTAMM